MMRTPDFQHEQRVPRRPHQVAPSGLAGVRLVFVVHAYRKPMPGTCDAGLSVTIVNTMKVLRRAGVHCECWSLKNAQELFARLDADEFSSARPITHMVINTPSFIWPWAFSKLSQRWVDIEFVQLNHSGLAYLSIDQFGVKHIRKVLDIQLATNNVFVAGNNQRFARWIMDDFGSESLYLPNLYDTTSYRNPVTSRADKDPLRVGSFGAGRHWKNQLVAAEAAISIARRLGVSLELYVNNDRWDANKSLSEARAELFYSFPGTKLIGVPWQAWPQFRRLVSTMDIMLSPSFDETFCVVVADGIAEGVPSVVTGAMEWAPRSWWCDPWDQASAASIGMALLHNRIGSVHDGRTQLTDFVSSGTNRWISYLTR